MFYAPLDERLENPLDIADNIENLQSALINRIERLLIRLALFEGTFSTDDFNRYGLSELMEYHSEASDMMLGYYKHIVKLKKIRHDLANVLASITILCDMLQTKGEISNKQLDRLIDSLASLAEFYKNLEELAKTRGTSNKFRPLKVIKDFGFKVEKTGKNLHGKVELTITKEEFILMLREIQMNARKYGMVDELEITASIYLEPSGDYVTCTFQDNGCGIKADDLERLRQHLAHDLQYRINPEVYGTGQGLLSIKEYGDLEIYSQGEGLGTKVTIRIPVKVEEA